MHGRCEYVCVCESAHTNARACRRGVGSNAPRSCRSLVGAAGHVPHPDPSLGGCGGALRSPVRVARRWSDSPGGGQGLHGGGWAGPGGPSPRASSRTSEPREEETGSGPRGPTSLPGVSLSGPCVYWVGCQDRAWVGDGGPGAGQVLRGKHGPLLSSEVTQNFLPAFPVEPKPLVHTDLPSGPGLNLPCKRSLADSLEPHALPYLCSRGTLPCPGSPRSMTSTSAVGGDTGGFRAPWTPGPVLHTGHLAGDVQRAVRPGRERPMVPEGKSSCRG